MELHEYPRPTNDTGIGVHWSVGFASAIGMGRIRDYWIPEMKAMGVKWVKIGNHDGAADFAELLLSEGFMPIVRIFKPSPNPGVLDVRDLVHLDTLIRIGVRYFEFNSEPDQDSEWKGGRVPANGLDLVVEHSIANMETILERGGMPAVPAVSNGCRWDILGKIVARGRRDLFDGPIWLAIHNYSRNRPMDYPYDIGNQEGAAYTDRFYNTIASEGWQEDAWRGRSLSEVNQLRLDRANPGSTVMDDHACWLAYEFFDARNRRHLGRSLPILSTECGYLVGEDTDPRYPATSPDLHMAQTLESCRVMMGASQRFASAPDYYFCTAFWLMGNSALGNSSTWCEPHAWYSDRWPGGVLPIVTALKAETKSVRRWAGMAEVGSHSVLRGSVRHAGDRRSVVLQKGDVEIQQVKLDRHSRYEIKNLLPGHYTVRVEGTQISETVNLLPGQEEAVVDLDLGQANESTSVSTVRGSVRGGAGAVIILLRSSDGEEWVSMAKEDGTFRFVDLPEGDYSVRLQGEVARQVLVHLDGVSESEVSLAQPGWGYSLKQTGIVKERGGLVVSVEGWPKLPVTVRAGNWESDPQLTGSAPDYSPDACVFMPLDAGHYMVSVGGVKDDSGQPLVIEAYVHYNGKEMPHVAFVNTVVATPDVKQESAIYGRVIGGHGRDLDLHVWLYDGQGRRLSQVVDADGAFEFIDLEAGYYSVEVVGFADVASKSDIALDGENTVSVELYIPFAGDEEGGGKYIGKSVVSGWAPDTAGKTVRLVDAVGNEYAQTVNIENHFYFNDLRAGTYAVQIEGGYEQIGLELDGRNATHIEFQPLIYTWQAIASPAGSMPGYSTVRVEVEEMRGLPVYIWKNDWEGMMRRTGSKPEFGECTVEFSPLGPGTYMVEPEGLGVWADVELTGLEAMWLDFRRIAVPSSPNIITVLENGFEDIVAATYGDQDSHDDSPEAAYDSSTNAEGYEPTLDDEFQLDFDWAVDTQAVLNSDADDLSTSQTESSTNAAGDSAESMPSQGTRRRAVPEETMDASAAAREPICILVFAMPERADEMQDLLNYARQVQAVFIEEVEEAAVYNKVIVVGNPTSDNMAEAVEQLRSMGKEPITDLQELLTPPWQ